MKIKLLTSNDEELDGYSTCESYKEICHICTPSQCDEIYGPLYLDLVHYSDIQNFLNVCHQYLCREGKLVIGGSDPYMLSKLLLDGEINYFEYNSIANSDQTLSIHAMHNIREAIQKLNMKIVNIHTNYQDALYVIEAKKL